MAPRGTISFRMPWNYLTHSETNDAEKWQKSAVLSRIWDVFGGANGAGYRIRTRGPLITNQVLYQLS